MNDPVIIIIIIIILIITKPLGSNFTGLAAVTPVTRKV